MKVERTKNGNIKLVISELQAWCIRDLYGKSSDSFRLKYTSEAQDNAFHYVWEALDDLLKNQKGEM